MKMQKRFITFEGGEGSGKSTQSRMLYESLKAKGLRVLLTREPGGTDVGESIRAILLTKDLGANTEILLNMASRAYHIETVIKPKLQEGFIVICDRFVDSTACYQGYATGQEIKKIYDLHNMMFDILPDITFLINTDPKEAVKRIEIRGEKSRFDEKSLEFHNKIYEGFNHIANLFENRIIRINGSKDPTLIQQDIISYL